MTFSVIRDALTLISMRSKIVHIAQFMLILLWLYTSTSKLLQFESFKQSLDRQHFPLAMTQLLYWALPTVEIILSALLVFHSTLYKGLVGSAFLLTVFTLYIAIILSHYFGQVPCSCGGVIASLSWKQHLFFNLFFLLLNVSAIINFNRERRLSAKDA